MSKQDTNTVELENEVVATTEETDADHATTINKDTWVRALATQMNTSQREAEAWLNGFKVVAQTLLTNFEKVPLSGVGVFELRQYTAPSVAPLSSEEKASGLTVAEKRAGAPTVTRRKVAFRAAAAIDRLLNPDKAAKHVAA